MFAEVPLHYFDKFEKEMHKFLAKHHWEVFHPIWGFFGVENTYILNFINEGIESLNLSQGRLISKIKAGLQ
jgi:hypothetical protein